MSWYYAGPEAKPVGPISVEELQNRRANGLVTSETYVIEQPGPEGSVPAWKRYREVFPSMAASPFPSSPEFPPVPPPPPSTAHPLFPSAAHAPISRPAVPPPIIEPHAAPHGHYPHRPTNKTCAWGFGLGIAAFVLSFACGFGLLIGLPALIVCILGFVHVQQNPAQSGRGLATAGAVLACMAMLISLIFLAFALPAAFKSYSQSTLQQNSE